MKCLLSAFVLVLICILIISTGCTSVRQASSGTPDQGSVLATQTPISVSGGDGEQVIVRIRDNSFDPSMLTIKEGTTVKWVNEDATSHRVSSTGSGEVRFDSQTIEPGSSFSHTFNERGRYEYADIQRSSMKGTIIVG